MKTGFLKRLLPSPSDGAAGVMSSSRRSALIGGVLLLLMLLTGWGWAVSSPLESSPDDDYHLGSIWCPRPVDDSCETKAVDGDKPAVRVPIAVSDGSACFAFQSDKSAACALGYEDTDMVWSTRYDAGEYPAGYYRFHHLLVGKDVQTSALVMRGVNVLIAVLLIGAVGFCMPRRLRRPFVGAVVVSWIPMGIYFIASNNPTSWALSGLFVYASAIYSASRQNGRARIILLLCALAGASMCLAARYDVSFYLFIVGLASLFAIRWTRQRWPELCLVIVMALMGVLSLLTSKPVSEVVNPAQESATEQTFTERLVIGIETAPKYLGGFWGHAWSPGWGDVPLLVRSPFILTIMAAGVFVAISLRRGGWRKWAALTTLVGAMVGLPAVFHALHATGAFEVIDAYQARYIMPLLAPTFFLMLALDQEEKAWLTAPQAVWIAICGSLCQAISLHTLLLRYVQGIKEQWELNLNEKIEWWWNVPVSPMMVWFVTTCAATAAVGIAMWMMTRSAGRTATSASGVSSPPSSPETPGREPQVVSGDE